MDSVQKVYPSVEELSSVLKNLKCPICPSRFNSKSNLTMHLAKTHKSDGLKPTCPNKIFFCPVITCNYNTNSNFKLLKFLKQHYLKMHADKKMNCNQCGKKFSTEAFRNRHEEYCQVTFQCCDCNMFYGCYETLKTHARRKQHSILEKIQYKSLVANDDRLCSKNTVQFANHKNLTANCTALRKNDEPRLFPQVSQLNVETQTVNEYPSRNRKCDTDTNVSLFQNICHSFKQVDTETSGYKPKLKTQTMCEVGLYSSSTSTHNSTYTDTSDLLTDTLNSNFFNCDSETQTDQIFGSYLFRYCEDYNYSHIHTQTSEDCFFDEIELNDRYTQTVPSDIFASAADPLLTSPTDETITKQNTAHMETQTEANIDEESSSVL